MLLLRAVRGQTSRLTSMIPLPESRSEVDMGTVAMTLPPERVSRHHQVTYWIVTSALRRYMYRMNRTAVLDIQRAGTLGIVKKYRSCEARQKFVILNVYFRR